MCARSVRWNDLVKINEHTAKFKVNLLQRVGNMRYCACRKCNNILKQLALCREKIDFIFLLFWK